MPSIQIEALDTLFFRDGKPFSMGDDTMATGIFPPPPSVFYGALRTSFAAQNNIELSTIEQDTAHITITGLNYLLEREPFFPLPLDLVQEKNDLSGKAKLLRPLALTGVTTNIQTSSNVTHLLYRPKHVEAISNAMLNSFEFGEYLNGKLKDYTFSSFNDLIKSEVKIGIGRNRDTATTSEGKLYRLEMKRLHLFDANNEDSVGKRFSFLLETNEVRLTPLTRIGAEGKMALFNPFEASFPIPSYQQDSQYFKVYFQTPAFFHEGAMPNWEKYLPNLGVSTVACAIGKPMFIGGFNMKKPVSPKKMLKAIPAGSVYYLHTTQTLSSVLNYIEAQKIKTFTDERANEGFGIFYIANLNFDKVLIQKP